MIRAWVAEDGRLVEAAEPRQALARAVWIDLLRPEEAERALVEKTLGGRLPDREEMLEIETSSRLHRADGGLVMTATLLAGTGTDEPVADPVTFFLRDGHLVTLRWIEPRAFDLFTTRARQEPLAEVTGEAVLAGLLDAVVDRLADALERVKRGTDRISRTVFREGVRGRDATEQLRSVLADIGRSGNLLSDIRESVAGLQRLLLFWRNARGRSDASGLTDTVDTLERDLASLAHHADFVANDIGFLLDATLGFISIEQNRTVEIFSVIAVLFLPPTLVASIYGMNFGYMPELAWPFGYPLALLLMFLSAWLPWRWFRRRGWL